MTSTRIHDGEGMNEGDTSPMPEDGEVVSAGVRGWRGGRPGLALRERTVALRQGVWRLLDRYQPLGPAPMEPWARATFGGMVALVVAYCAFFCAFLFAQQDTFVTHAEDMGIMQQALWNTTHGAFMHQTICNIVSDTNCIGNVSRFAIHFEALMVPLALLYHVIPSAKFLQFVQVVVVASGAFPAYWLASRRLRSSLAGLIFALAYLLFPALEAAVTFDFHAVTLAAAFLMFALYFMMTRNNVGLVIACVLAMATKEEIPADVIMIGLSIVFLQRRPQFGWRVVGMACVWLVAELVIMHAASPLGHSPTASRFAQLGHSPTQVALYLLLHPVQVLQNYVFEPGHFYYLRVMLSPVAYLPIFSPLAVALALPELAINLLSSDRSMFSGVYQYNAAIVPILIFAAIESVALIVFVVRVLTRRAQSWATATPDAESVSPEATQRGSGIETSDLTQRLTVLRATVERRYAEVRAAGRRWLAPRVAPPAARPAQVWRVGRIALLVVLACVLFMSVREQRALGYTPLANSFVWPQVTSHDAIGNQIAASIPANASVVAQANLVPHVANRAHIYQFPDLPPDVDYVFLDVTSNIYPLLGSSETYYGAVEGLLEGGRYHVVAARDGYLLLQRGAPQGTPQDAMGPYHLPASFYSFTETPPGQVPNPIQPVHYGNALDLVGYAVSPAPVVYLQQPWLTVTAYFKVTAPISQDLVPTINVYYQDGRYDQHFDAPTIALLPTSDWQVGKIYAVTLNNFFINNADLGTMQIGTHVDAPGGPLSVTPPKGTPANRVTGDGTVYLFTTEVGKP